MKNFKTRKDRRKKKIPERKNSKIFFTEIFLPNFEERRVGVRPRRDLEKFMNNDKISSLPFLHSCSFRFARPRALPHQLYTPIDRIHTYRMPISVLPSRSPSIALSILPLLVARTSTSNLFGWVIIIIECAWIYVPCTYLHAIRMPIRTVIHIHAQGMVSSKGTPAHIHYLYRIHVVVNDVYTILFVSVYTYIHALYTDVVSYT